MPPRDPLDERILSLLREDGRITSAALPPPLGSLLPPACGG